MICGHLMRKDSSSHRKLLKSKSGDAGVPIAYLRQDQAWKIDKHISRINVFCLLEFLRKLGFCKIVRSKYHEKQKQHQSARKRSENTM